jgi:adenylate kinase
MNIILLGPGAGKVKLIYSVKLIVLRESLRGICCVAQSRNTSLNGLQAQKIMARGQLVPDHLIIDLVKTRLADQDCRHGFLLDGLYVASGGGYSAGRHQHRLCD